MKKVILLFMILILSCISVFSLNTTVALNEIVIGQLVNWQITIDNDNINIPNNCYNVISNSDMDKDMYVIENDTKYSMRNYDNLVVSRGKSLITSSTKGSPKGNITVNIPATINTGFTTTLWFKSNDTRSITCTSLPPITENTILNYNKNIIKISSDTHYYNITSFYDFPKGVKKENIKLYELTNTTKTLITNITYQDNTTDGLIDRIIWKVPHLSDKYYEIIVINNAIWLNETKDYIADVYINISQQDYIMQQVKENQYIRVTFEKPLYNGNDITIFAQYDNAPENQTMQVQVYESNTNNLLMTIENIGDFFKYRNIFTNLSYPIDTFDLKFINGNASVDFIIDPPSNAMLKSVQHGTSNMTSTSLTITISSVTLANSILFFSFAASSTNAADNNAACNLSTSTTITCSRAAATSSWVDVNWYVAEFVSGVTVQRGAIANVVTNLATINPVNTSSTFTSGADTNAGTAIGNDDWAITWLQNATRINATAGTTNTDFVYWQAIDYSGAKVQRGLTNGDTIQLNATITEVNESKSFVRGTFFISSSTGNPANSAGLLNFTNSTRIQTKKVTTGTNTIRTAWEVVEFTGDEFVQSGDLNLPAGTKTATVDLPINVNISASVVEVGMFNGLCGNTTATAWTECYTTANLTTKNTVTIWRTTAASSVWVHWSVISFDLNQSTTPPPIQCEKYSGTGQWNINCSNNCHYTTTENLFNNNINITGTGTFNINSTLWNISQVWVNKDSNWFSDSCTVYVNTQNNGLLNLSN